MPSGTRAGGAGGSALRGRLLALAAAGMTAGNLAQAWTAVVQALGAT